MIHSTIAKAAMEEVHQEMKINHATKSPGGRTSTSIPPPLRGFLIRVNHPQMLARTITVKEGDGSLRERAPLSIEKGPAHTGAMTDE